MKKEGPLTEGVRLFVAGDHKDADVRRYVSTMLCNEIDSVRRDHARAEIHERRWSKSPGDERLDEARAHVAWAAERVEAVRVDARAAAQVAEGAGVRLDHRAEKALRGIGARTADEMSVAKRVTAGQRTATVELAPDERSSVARMLYEEMGSKSLSVQDRVEAGVEVFTQRELAMISMASGKRTPDSVSKALVDLRESPTQQASADVTRSRGTSASRGQSVLQALRQMPAVEPTVETTVEPVRRQAPTPGPLPVFGTPVGPVASTEPEVEAGGIESPEMDEDPVRSGTDSDRLVPDGQWTRTDQGSSGQPTLF